MTTESELADKGPDAKTAEMRVNPLDIAKLAAIMPHEYVVGHAAKGGNVRDDPDSRTLAALELIQAAGKHLAKLAKASEPKPA